MSSTESTSSSSPELPKKRQKINSTSQVETKKTEPQLRKFSKIPIFIVDYHNDVLEFVYRCFGARYLPLHNNSILHFDSHPDMVIPRDLKPSTVYEKTKLLESLSIENWIMPTCYAGHFSKIVWAKNSWCKQIPIGSYEFKIGDHNDEIQVNLPINYFLSEGNYCAEKNLNNQEAITLKVVETDKELDPGEISNIIDGIYILDIDLDFFSTRNPFIEVYKSAKCYQKVEEIFRYELDEKNPEEFCQRRKAQLDYLEIIFGHLAVERNLDDFVEESDCAVDLNKIKEFVKSMTEVYNDEDIDWMLVYNSGCTSDSDGLPHHISTDLDLKRYFGDFENFLRHLKNLPVAITIARSAEDDYCPMDQVDFIQDSVLQILQKVFDDKLSDKPILYYEDVEWDIVNL